MYALNDAYKGVVSRETCRTFKRNDFCGRTKRMDKLPYSAKAVVFRAHNCVRNFLFRRAL